MSSCFRLGYICGLRSRVPGRLAVSKYQKDSTPVVVKHKHCAICSTPIPMSKDFCSTTCEDENKRLLRRRKYTFILTLAMFPVLFLLLFLFRR